MATIETAIRRLAEDFGLNAMVAGFMDCGVTATLGDPLNGILAERNFALADLDQVGDWLLEEAAKPRPPRAPAQPTRLDQDALDRVIAELGIAVEHDARR